MADEIKIIISTDVAAAKRDTAKLAKGFKAAEQAANKTTTAIKKTSEAIKKQEGFWTTLGKRLRTFASGAGLANETFRILRFRSMELTRSIIQFGVRSTKASSDFLGFRNALQIASGSLGEANKSMQKADEIATTLGLDLTAVTKEYSKFVNSVTLAGQTMEFAEKSFQQFAVTARVLNLNGQETSGMFLALEQMVSKGTVSMEELRRQLGQHLPGAVALAAKAMGYGKDQLKEFYSEVRKGNVASDELVGKLGNLLARRTAPLLEQALEKSTVAVTRFKNELLKLQVTIGQYLQPAVTWFFNSLATLVGWFRTTAFESNIFQNELKDVTDALNNTAEAVKPIALAFGSFESNADRVTATLGTNIGAIGLLGVTAVTGAKSLQLLGKAALWMLDPFIKFGKWLGKSRFASIITKVNPVVAAVTAMGTAFAGVWIWLEKMQREADATDQSWKKFNISLRDTGPAADIARESLYELATTMEGVQRIGATYAGSFGEIQALQKRQADLNLYIAATSQLMLTSSVALGEKGLAPLAQKLEDYREELDSIPEKIRALSEEQGKYKTVLKSLGEATGEDNKKTKVRLTLAERQTAAYKEELKLLNFYIDDIDTALEKEELYNLEKQFGNITRAKTIQGLKEEVELNKAMAEWRKEQAEAIESPDKTLFDDFDNSPMQEFLENAPDQAMELENVYVNAFKSMEDSMTSFLTTGKLNFADFAKSIISDLARMIAKQLIFNAISGLFGGGGAVSAGTTAFGSSTGAFAKGIGGFTARGLADGTNYVPRDGLKYLHKGEAVVPAKYNKEQDVRQGKTTIININGVTDFGSFRRNIDQLRNIDQREQAHATRNL